MRAASILLFVVVTGTGGEICLTRAMKMLGEAHDFHPRAILSFVLRALRIGWLWFAVLLMAASFFSFLAMLSWFPVSFVIPATSLAYVAGAFGAKIFLGEQLNATRWAGIFLICLGVAMAWVDDLPEIPALSFRDRDPPLGDSGAGAGSAFLLPRCNLFRLAIFPRGASRSEPNAARERANSVRSAC